MVTSTTSGFGTNTQSYENYYDFSGSGASVSGPTQPEDSGNNPVMFDQGMMMKSEVESPHPVFPNHSSVMTNYGSTPDPSESFNIRLVFRNFLQLFKLHANF